jgi:prevent-host-death family protein
MAKTMSAATFKAHCLEVLDTVANTSEPVVVTKRGKPVAKLVPADPPAPKSVFGCMIDQTKIVGDVEKPAWSEEQWKQFERERVEQAKAWDLEWRTYGTISGKKTVGQPPHLARKKAGPARPSKKGRR